MKKIIGAVISCIVLAAIAFYAKEKEVKEVLMASTVFKTKEDVNHAALTLNETKIVSEATGEVESLEEFESEFLKKTDEEIRSAILANDREAEKKNFIALANANQLDQKMTAEFVKYIRLNGALHKILMERNLEALEMESI